MIRAAWADERSGGALDGEHYRAGRREPRPRAGHAVEIWIGAYKPRMLALTGRVGDGWLPSRLLPPEQLADMNARIDEAALAAGREPAQIRRLYNINPTTDSGLGRVTGRAGRRADGMSTFILAVTTPGGARVRVGDRPGRPRAGRPRVPGARTDGLPHRPAATPPPAGGGAGRSRPGRA